MDRKRIKLPEMNFFKTMHSCKSTKFPGVSLILLLGLLFLSAISPIQAQIGIVGATTVSQGSTTSYTVTLNGNGGATYTGSYTWTVTGGIIVATGTSTRTATCTGCMYYSMGISVVWSATATSGSVTYTNSVGSKSISVTIVPPLNPGTISPANQTINYNTVPTSLAGTLATGGAATPAYAYQWMSSPDNVNWTDISGATLRNYAPVALTATTYFMRKVTETTTGTVGYSNSALVTVYPQLTAGVAPLSQTINSGSSAATLTCTAGGGSGTYTYQWQSSPDYTTWTNTVTTSSISPGVLTATRYYRCQVTSNGATVTSATATVTVSAAPVASLSITNTTASGNGSINTLTATASGGNGTYTYAWFSSINNGATFSPVSASGSTYITPVITQSTQYYVAVTSGGITTNSNTINIVIPGKPTVSSSAGAICNGAAVNLTASGSTGTYTWYNGSGTAVYTGTIFTTSVAGTYTVKAANGFGISVASDPVILASLTAPVVAPIVGPTVCVNGSTMKLTDATVGGKWTSITTSIGTIDSISGVFRGTSEGVTEIRYTVVNGCGTVSQSLSVTVGAAASVMQTLGKGVKDPVISTQSINLANNAVGILEYPYDSLLTAAHSIRNVVSLRVVEETGSYIPGDFTASVKLRIEYGHTDQQLNVLDNVYLKVNYKKDSGTKYDALNYIWFRDAEYVKVTVIAVTAPTATDNSISFNTASVLSLTSAMEPIRYFTIMDNAKPVLSFPDTTSQVRDELVVNWTHPQRANQNNTQLEWTWVEDELDAIYRNGTLFDTASLFRTGAARLDIAGAGLMGSYAIPLVYGGKGRLYVRVRGNTLLPSGSRSDGPWSAVKTYTYNGHADSLNWQRTTTFAEEGKQKTVVQYYDGSLRARQTVTKDNVTGKTVVAETLYDGAGRPALQILPAPGINNIIGYTAYFNLFNSAAQDLTYDPLEYFDFTTPSLGEYKTAPLSTVSGASNYYSPQNADLSSPNTSLVKQTKQLPDAKGFPYTITRYMPDGTGRIMRQSGVGDSLNMGSGHETRYFYGTPTQRELDALFGTEVGNATHYFKNMVMDANGQMSVSYVDMHGRTIATALAGDAPGAVQALNTGAGGQYAAQDNRTLVQDLLDKGTNLLKEKSIESTSTILVPAAGSYQFNYTLPVVKLDLPTCSGGIMSMNMRFDLVISVADESGSKPSKDTLLTNVEVVNLQYSLPLDPGSYSVRKTLKINQGAMDSLYALYNQPGIGICRTEKQLADSIAAVDSLASGCAIPRPALTAQQCRDSLGTYSNYLIRYAASVGLLNAQQLGDTTQLSVDQKTRLRNQYLSDSAFCSSIDPARSNTLEQIRSQMLQDYMPFSGQFTNTAFPDSIAQRYSIFSTLYNSITRTPYYKLPKTATGQNGRYYTDEGLVEPEVDSVALSTMTSTDYALRYKPSWGASLIYYHPEYAKWKFASDSLRKVYDFGDSLQLGTTLPFYPVTNDPFFSTISTGKDRDTIIRYSNVSWRGGPYSMWKTAYGSAFGCAQQLDTALRRACYNNMPSVYTATGTQVNTGSGLVTLSAEYQSQAWTYYKGLYTQERSTMVNAYLAARRGDPYSTAAGLTAYRIYFPVSGLQAAQNLGWTGWYPNASGQLPVVNITDSVKNYSNYCEGYIEPWKSALRNCAALQARFSADSLDLVLTDIANRLLVVCSRGTDAANPAGATNVSPANSSLPGYKNFEDVVFAYFDSLAISRTTLCNPYLIEAPKPWGTNSPLITAMAVSVDTCNCTLFRNLKTLVYTSEYDSSTLTGINYYLKGINEDTLSTDLYNVLKQSCGRIYLTNCRLVSGVMKCDTTYTYPLLRPQVLPRRLTCGFTEPQICYSCTNFKNYDSLFNIWMGRHIKFGGDLNNDSVLSWNILFARYLNYKTGMNLSWQEYSNKLKTANCRDFWVIPDTGTTNMFTTNICFTRVPNNDTTGLSFTEPTKCQNLRSQAVHKSALLYKQIQEERLSGFQKLLLTQPLGVTERLWISNTVKEYHYTLYYYDQAGNLVKTVPPKGVRPRFEQSYFDSLATARLNGTDKTPVHTLTTDYRYNSLNQVVSQNTPDAATSRFYYDRLGRLVISQNAKQAAAGNVYSYTLYDLLGRITEVGQTSSATAMTQATASNATSLQNWFNGAGANRNQITQTMYDQAYPPTVGLNLNQSNLRNRVSYSVVFNQASDTYPASASYYSYDIHGNVDTLVQDFGSRSGIANSMNEVVGGTDNRFKRIVYNYDLISGKVNQVSYQPGKDDSWYHRYQYDAENRLTDVISGRDSVMLFLFPEREARYNYYKHGPLAQTELGQLRVQRLDYAYTLQGWLKAINPAMGGTLANGTDTTEPYPVAQDVYGFSLHYFKNDYKPIGTYSGTGSTSILGALAGNAYSLYNGNIAAMAVNIPKLGGPQVYNYRYDQLNRLVAMDAYTGLNINGGTFNSPTNSGAYKEQISYDPNGNILTYLRNGDNQRKPMDDLSYTYYSGTNQLKSVSDPITDASAIDYPKYNDLKGGQAATNYSYDQIGNMTADLSEGITDITWTVYGKIASITKSGTFIRYTYDASGNRISKQTPTDTTYYVRDASGNVMAVYTRAQGTTSKLGLSEVHLYGSSRLGMTTTHAAPDSTLALLGGFGSAKKLIFTRGEKLFELSNHLGNVLVTITDRRVQLTTNNTTVSSYRADVSSANDYYPFGMLMPGRRYTASTYRYGFNGKENDNNVKGEGNEQDYGMRIYDSRIGKFLSVDPLTSKYPWLTPFQFASNNPIKLIDIDGLEGGEPPLPGSQGKKEGEKVTTRSDKLKYAPSDCGCSEADDGYYETKDWFWYSGNKNRVAKAGWYSKEEYDLINQDWENGQVLPPMSLLEKFPAYSASSREWNGWGVDYKGYLTGRAPDPDLSILVGGFGGKAGKVVTGLKLMGAANKNKAALWTIYMGLKKIENEGDKLFLYIGKAKNGIAARYSASKLSELQIQAFGLLTKIPDNGTALGVEQAIMELNGWVNKAENLVKPVLSNRNAATIKEIYKSQGLEWLKVNVPNWENLYKMQ